MTFHLFGLVRLILWLLSDHLSCQRRALPCISRRDCEAIYGRGHGFYLFKPSPRTKRKSITFWLTQAKVRNVCVTRLTLHDKASLALPLVSQDVFPLVSRAAGETAFLSVKPNREHYLVLWCCGWDCLKPTGMVWAAASVVGKVKVEETQPRASS